MININDATAALAPKGFRLTDGWQAVVMNCAAAVEVKRYDGRSVEVRMINGSRKLGFVLTPTALRELSAFCAALADYLERGQG